MKTKMLFIACVFVPFYSIAQVTITSNVFPVVGDTIVRFFSDTTGVQPGPSGMGVTWNFSNLNAGQITTRIYLNPAQTPYGADYPGAVLCRKNFIDTYFTYWTPSSSKAEYHGFTEIGNTDVKLVDPANYYVFPASVGTIASDSVYSVSAGGTLMSPGRHYFNADASGTLILPNAIYPNSLRIKTELYVGDSAINSFSLNTEYSWFVPNKKDILLVIGSLNLNGTITRYVLFDNGPNLTFINDLHLSIDKIRTFPNPVSKKLQFSGVKIADHNMMVDVIGLDGRLVSKHAIFRSNSLKDYFEMDTESLKPGPYILRIFSDDKIEHLKIIKLQ
jgi:hypothetical protein